MLRRRRRRLLLPRCPGRPPSPPPPSTPPASNRFPRGGAPAVVLGRNTDRPVVVVRGGASARECVDRFFLFCFVCNLTTLRLRPLFSIVSRRQYYIISQYSFVNRSPHRDLVSRFPRPDSARRRSTRARVHAVRTAAGKDGIAADAMFSSRSRSSVRLKDPKQRSV